MDVIPVLDLQGGIVVGALRGERERYRPLRSCLTPSCAPLEVAQAFREQLGLDRLYIADLDAICGRPANFGLLERLAGAGARILLDPGIRGARDLASCPLECCEAIILGTETLSSLATVERALAVAGPERTVVSIDFRGEAVLRSCPELGRDPLAIAAQLAALGVERFILLQLGRVGTGAGVPEPIAELACAMAERAATTLVGGGIRSADEILRLGARRVAGVLVARALHDGTITRAHIEAIRSPKEPS
jgi:phosphoribosylformimino-5-aminoimidazole carboxamide ribotide isomerase